MQSSRDLVKMVEKCHERGVLFILHCLYKYPKYYSTFHDIHDISSIFGDIII